MKQVYQTEDGKTFDSAKEAYAYEAMLSKKQVNNLDKVMKCYGVRRSIEMYGLDKQGTWKLTSEDPNCDMGGYHHEPLIGYYKGTLRHVIKVASETSGFFGWGSGGSITLVSITSL